MASFLAIYICTPQLFRYTKTTKEEISIKRLRMKTGIATLFVVTGFIEFANTSADAKVVWTFGTSDKSIRTAPKSIRSTCYGYQSSYDTHPTYKSAKHTTVVNFYGGK